LDKASKVSFTVKSEQKTPNTIEKIKEKYIINVHLASLSKLTASTEVKKSFDGGSAYYKGQTFVQSGLLLLHVNQTEITEHNININPRSEDFKLTMNHQKMPLICNAGK
jgi:hypothetical protein